MKRRAMITAAVLIAVILKIYLASAYFGNFDQESYQLVVKIARAGGNVYAETARYNYSPVWLQIMLWLDTVALDLNLPFHTVLRTFLTLTDTLNILFIGLIAAKTRPGGALAPVLAYALNPIPILLVGFHGQFECFAILPLLIATYFLVSRPNPPRLLIWVLATLSLLIKHITLFGVWALFIQSAKSARSAAAMIVASSAVFLASFIPYLPEGGQGIIQNVFLYKGLTGLYGTSLFLPLAVGYPLFLAVILALPLIEKRLYGFRPVESPKNTFVTFLALAPGISEQYFLLPVPMASIHPSRWYWLYTACASLFLLASKYNVRLLIILDPWRGILWNIVWVAAALWFAAILVRLYRSRSQSPAKQHAAQ